MPVQCIKCWKFVYRHETRLEPLAPGDIEFSVEHESVPSGVRAALSQGDLALTAAVMNQQRALNSELDCYMRLRSEGQEKRWEPRYAKSQGEDQERYLRRATQIALEDRSCPYFEPYVPVLQLKEQVALAQKAEVDAVANRVRAESLSRQIRTLNERLTTVAGLEPHERGLEFQHLMRDLFEAYGLKPKENLVLPGEQIDLIFGPMELTKVVAEIEWRSEPVGANEVREFHGKLHDRSPRIVGMYVSMSGFSGPAINEARSSLQRRLMVLIGPEEVEQLFGGKVNLISLLEEKIAGAEERKDPI